VSDPFEGWAIVELMGHRRLAGHVSEQEIAGTGMLRLDVPAAAGPGVTQFYSPSALYCLTPTTEDIARKVAARLLPRPVSPYELTPPAAAAAPGDDDADDDLDYEPVTGGREPDPWG
jgi:hypothetical protein